MPGSTPLQLYSYPTTGDQASPAGIQTLAQAIEKQVVAVFPDAATRDSRWTSATGLANGAMCFLASTGELQIRSGGAWVVIGGRASSFAMASGSYSVTYAGGTSWGNTGVSNVTFPAGRFSAAPLVMSGNVWTSGAAVGGGYTAMQISAVTTTGFTATGAISGTGAATLSYSYLAIQMTSAAANG